MIIVEGARGYHVGGIAALIEPDQARELAWAERFVSSQPDLKWILGNFVEADNPNGNGHIFPLTDLRKAQPTIAHKPLNMLHREHYIVGCYAGSELIDPATETAGAGVVNPHVEALAAFYRYYYPELYDDVVVPAHREGALYFSMEAVPKSLTCRGLGDDPGCGREYAYKGRIHDSYCEHLQQPGSRKQLNKHHFTAGALIVPPVRPGWRQAHSIELSHAFEPGELSRLIEQNLEEAEMAYEQIATEFPHLEASQWESIMVQLLAAANDGKTVVVSGPGVGGPTSDKSGTVTINIPVDVATGRTRSGPVEDESTSPPASLPDGTWMVLNRDDLKERVQRASSNGNGIGVVRRHLMRRADALGAMDMIPAAWKQAYPDWQRMDAADLVSNRGMLASLGFALHDDYGLEYEIARDFNQGRRADLAKKGLAIPIRNEKGEIVGGRYPIVTVSDLRNAVEAIGRAASGGAAQVKAFIKKRAGALGATKLIPAGW